MLPDYIEILELVEPVEVPRIVRAADDDHVIACALVAKADLIVASRSSIIAITVVVASASS